MSQYRAFFLLILAVVTGAPGCGDPPTSKYPEQQDYPEDTKLGPGDIFQVRVYQQEAMSTTYSINSKGTISFPLIGIVKVAGLTPAEVEEELVRRLADGYLRAPQVSVLVEEYKSKKISIFGEVRKPGTIPYSDGMMVVEAISQAGGFSNMAHKNAVTISRNRNGDTSKYTVAVEKIGRGEAANFPMRPGDVIFVPRRKW